MLCYLSNGPLRAIEKENFKLVILKTVTFTYENIEIRLRNFLVFWETGHQGDAAATRGSTVVADLGKRPVGTIPASSPLKKKTQKEEKPTRQAKQPPLP